MKHLVLILLCLLGNYSLHSQVYSKKIIYKYQIENSSTEGIKKKQIMYLVCNGKAWVFDPQKQFSVGWVDEEKDISSPNSSTGVIDNGDTVWLHPPRHDIYFVHEFTPFPEVRLPLEVGKQWTTDFGYVWSSKELNIPAGVKVKPHYTVEAKFEDYSDILYRTINCYKVMGEINNQFINSKWIGIFNDELGFIRMEFINTNKSITKMNLLDSFDWDQCKERFGLFSL
ncbi:hypothetical protein [Marinifilum flexuosum]|uniref:Uncharacterized protein n=1 Tax=Marinifilum flexuosum TaxID=1117708 RepID=A0A419X5W8_9BACT|nr:hypothetical protein [Marinifilum flexuosum]RKE03085.1 hypothetical protein BXY64_0075 [Marinifilum flexuosum]